MEKGSGFAGSFSIFPFPFFFFVLHFLFGLFVIFMLII